jgi:S1-C subfamily serine protease
LEVRKMVTGSTGSGLEFLDFPFSGEPDNASAPGLESGAGVLAAYSHAVMNVVAKVGPAVVHVFIKRRASRSRDANRRDGSGSGVIITPDGYIVTNSHVVETAENVEVGLADGSRYTAEVIGKDPATDLGLLRIPGSGLPAAHLGDSEGLKVGQLAIAIGNPLGFQSTVTTGVITLWGVRCAAGVAGSLRTSSRRMPLSTRATAADLWLTPVAWW